MSITLMQYFLLVIIILAAFPLGFLLAKFTKEELKSGRLWFNIIIVASIIVIIGSFCMKACTEDFLLISASMLFLIIITSISLKKSYKTRKKINESKR